MQKFPQSLRELIEEMHHWKQEDALCCLDLIMEALSDVYFADFSEGVHDMGRQEHRHRSPANLVRASDIASKYYGTNVGAFFVALQDVLPIDCIAKAKSCEQFESIPADETQRTAQGEPQVSLITRMLILAKDEIRNKPQTPQSMQAKMKGAIKRLFGLS